MMRSMTLHVGAREFVAGRASLDFAGLRGGRVFYLMLWPKRFGVYVGWIG